MDESGASIFLSIRDALTPTVLFLLLNLVIATIFLSSKTRRHHESDPNPAEPEPHHRLGPTGFERVRSIGLERVRSIGLFRFGSPDVPQPELDTTQIHVHQNPPSALERVRSINLFRFGSRDIPQPDTYQPESQEEEHYDMEHHFRRIQSESSASRPKPVMAEERGTLRKLASALSWRATEPETIRRRPAPASAREVAAVEEEEVDARADDFINRFRQQLHLQRLDSIMRYKEMLIRGR